MPSRGTASAPRSSPSCGRPGSASRGASIGRDGLDEPRDVGGRDRLSRVLFQERGVRHVVGGSAATLDVQLNAFEEVRAPKRMARVQVTVTLHDQRVVLWEETLTIEQPVAARGKGDLADAVVAALGESLRITVDRIADRVVRELAAIEPAAAPPERRSMSERTP